MRSRIPAILMIRMQPAATMPSFHQAWVTALVGVISGLLVSIPVGPINITILNEGVQRGFWWAFLIGLGSVAMEVIYCAIGFAGFSELFDTPWLRACMELASFLLMTYIGFKYLLMKSLAISGKTAEKMEHRFHPHTAFMVGFLRVLANPNVLLGWITISATFIAHEWVSPNWTSKLICISGVAVGSLGWFFALSLLVGWGRGRFSARHLLRMSQFSGLSLLIMAAFIGGRIVALLKERLIHP
jgi:L-lysine exporter family protein LysE/ArgO